MNKSMYQPIPKHGLFCNLTGLNFGRLQVVGYLGRIGANNTWDCVCVCGEKRAVSGGNLKIGHTQSCGCLHKERTSKVSTTHGQSRLSEYRIWCHMKRRCFDVNSESYKRYGARGITVCEKWAASFEEFFFDMGQRPTEKHSIDRIDNDGNYEPGNCRWATSKEQANNTRANVLITINGITKPLSIWADENGLDRSVIVSRVANGDVGEYLVRPSGLRTKKITVNGITDTYTGWGNRLGIKPETISQRIRRDKWSVEKSLTHRAS